AVVGFKTVHLDEQLVERLLALIVTAAEARTAVTTDSVDLVDEDDAGSILFTLLKQVADTRGTDTDEHFDEVGTRDREEGHVRLAGDSLGKQGLTRSRRANHQDALGDLAAQFLELLRVLEEFDDLLQLFLGLFDTGNVLEGDTFLLVVEQFCTGFAEAEGLVAARLHLAERKREEPDQQQEGQSLDQKQPAPTGGDSFFVGLYRCAGIFFVELVDLLKKHLTGRIAADRGHPLRSCGIDKFDLRLLEISFFEVLI